MNNIKFLSNTNYCIQFSIKRSEYIVWPSEYIYLTVYNCLKHFIGLKLVYKFGNTVKSLAYSLLMELATIIFFFLPFGCLNLSENVWSLFVSFFYLNKSCIFYFKIILRIIYLLILLLILSKLSFAQNRF